MGRKSVRKNELFRSGGLLSFPRTGCALRASVILSRGQKSHDIGLQTAKAGNPDSKHAGLFRILARLAPIDFVDARAYSKR
jgi:hypothetical protein